MKQKIVLCSLLLLFTIAGFGCFSVTEWFLGSIVKPKENTLVVQETIVQTVTIRPPFITSRQYYWWHAGYNNLRLYPYQWLSHWQGRRQLWYNEGRQCWWKDNVDPMFWPGQLQQYGTGGPSSWTLKQYNVTPKSKRRTMIPRDTKGGIDRYVDRGVPTGSFLRAVLSNDLFEAVAKADYHNKLALAAICEYIYNYTPDTCHGSPEVVAAWLKFHRENPTEANRAAGMDRERRERYYDQESRK